MNTPLCLVLEDVHKSFDKREVLKKKTGKTGAK